MCGNHPGHRKLGSIGRPTLNMRVRILDDAGRELPPGQEGEMVVSGRQLASAYWQGPDKLVPIPQDGFRNGDLAAARRRGLRLHHRPQEGHHHQGRRQHRLARDHELPARAPDVADAGNARRAGRHLRRGAGGLRRARGPGEPGRSHAARALPRQAGGLQGARGRRHRRGRSEERERQDRSRRARRDLAAADRAADRHSARDTGA